MIKERLNEIQVTTEYVSSRVSDDFQHDCTKLLEYESRELQTVAGFVKELIATINAQSEELRRADRDFASRAADLLMQRTEIEKQAKRIEELETILKKIQGWA